nr:MAG TPA: hypothetical protein [Caudoviricetes sp.]
MFGHWVLAYSVAFYFSVTIVKKYLVTDKVS